MRLVMRTIAPNVSAMVPSKSKIKNATYPATEVVDEDLSVLIYHKANSETPKV